MPFTVTRGCLSFCPVKAYFNAVIGVSSRMQDTYHLLPNSITAAFHKKGMMSVDIPHAAILLWLPESHYTNFCMRTWNLLSHKLVMQALFLIILLYDLIILLFQMSNSSYLKLDPRTFNTQQLNNNSKSETLGTYQNCKLKRKRRKTAAILMILDSE